MSRLGDWLRGLFGGRASEPPPPAPPRPAPRPPRDVDAEIRAGEERLRQAFMDQGTLWPLAAAYHHRGCVRRASGDREAGRNDLARAAELDVFSRYVTSLAICLDEDGEREAARRAHDQAVGALKREEAARRGPLGGFPPANAERDAARTLLARAVHLLAVDEPGLAIADLERAIEAKASADAFAALSVAHRRAGALDDARRAAERGLELDPESESARRALSAIEA